jgi:hypothetical protein
VAVDGHLIRRSFSLLTASRRRPTGSQAPLVRAIPRGRRAAGEIWAGRTRSDRAHGSFVLGAYLTIYFRSVNLLLDLNQNKFVKCMKIYRSNFILVLEPLLNHAEQVACQINS